MSEKPPLARRSSGGPAVDQRGTSFGGGYPLVGVGLPISHKMTPHLFLAVSHGRKDSYGIGLLRCAAAGGDRRRDEQPMGRNHSTRAWAHPQL